MKKTILASLAAYSVLLIQSCGKTENSKGLNASSMLKSNKLIAGADVFIGGTVPTGTYKIVTGPTINVTNKTMGVNASLDWGAPVQQLDYTINTGSDWRVTDLGNGYYSIINTYSGQALTLGDGSLPEHEQIIQFGYGGIDAQQWKVDYQGAFGVYRIESKLNVLKGANVDPFSDSSGTPIKLETYPTGNQGAGYFFLSPVVVTYQDQLATNFFRRTSGWINSDGGSSVLLNNGKILWLMGDSNIGQYDPNTGTVPCLAVSVRNSGLLQPSVTDWDWQHASTLLGDNYPGRNSYIKQYPSDDTRWIWPGCGFQLPSNDTVYVICTPLKNGGSGWVDDGNKVFAKILSSTMKVVSYKTLQDFNGINFGIGAVKETDGYVYVYGEKQTFIVSDVFVARFPMSNPNADWTFWNGSGWDSLATNAMKVGQAESTGANVVKVNNKYILTSTQFSMGCGTTSYNMYASTSSSATGPFTNEHVIYTIPDRYQGHTPFWYAPNAHPEFNTTSNELLITYALNGYCGADCVNGRTNPDYYRPKAIRVPFSVIDPSL